MSILVKHQQTHLKYSTRSKVWVWCEFYQAKTQTFDM